MKTYRLTAVLLAIVIAPLSYSSTPAWQVKESPENEIVQCLSLCPEGNLLAGVFGKGVFISTDKADSWHDANNGLTSLNVMSLVRDGRGHVFASTFGGGVCYSSDNCRTWTAINDGLSNQEVVALTEDEGVLYAGTAYGGVYRLGSIGAEWEYVGLRGQFVNAFIVDRLHRVFAGTDRGVYVLERGSIAWKEKNSGLRSTTVRALAVDEQGDVYAGTNGGGLYVLSGRGKKWALLGETLGDLHIGSIIAGPEGNLTVGTARGVYNSVNHGKTWSMLGSMEDRKAVTSLVLNLSGEYFAATHAGTLLKKSVPAYSAR